MIRALLDSLRYAARTLARRPGFAATAAFTLALGLGGSSALFTFVNAVLLRPLPYRDPTRLVRVTRVIPQFQMEVAGSGDYADWRDHSRSFAALSAFSDGGAVTLTGRGSPERLHSARVTANFLPTLGVAPSWGRGILPEEDRPSGSKPIVLTDPLWRRLFPGIAPGGEKALEIDGGLHTVVGVLPSGFALPGRPEVELLLPLALDEAKDRQDGRQVIVTVVGRLQPAIAVETARAELEAILSAKEQGRDPASHAMVVTGAAPDLAPRGAPAPSRDVMLKVVPLHKALTADLRPALQLFAVAVGLLLTVAIANVASLLLARGVARQQEMAIRAALGASRGRLLGITLAESLVVALLGGGLGLALAAGAVRALVALMPSQLAIALQNTGGVHLDLRVAGFALAISLVASFLAGILPALVSSRTHPAERLREAIPSASSGLSRRRIRGTLVATEIALAFVLLAGTGLLARSFDRLLALDPGFEGSRVLTLAVELDEARHPDSEAYPAFFERLVEKVRAIPGVEYAAAGDSLPLKPFSTLMLDVQSEGQARAPAGAGPDFAICAVTPDYFRTMGITLVRGRSFGLEDRGDSPPVAVVNSTLARRLFGSANPLGRRVRFGPPAAPWVSVVGVSADARHEGLEHDPRPVVYRPFAQKGRGFAFVAIRSAVAPTSLVASARGAVAALDPDLAVHDVATMGQRLRDAVAPRRFNTLLLGAFAATTLVLAAIGLYGSLAYAVTERTREFAIRVSIGAKPAQIRGLVLGQGLPAVGAGLVSGGALALAAGSALRAALFGVAPADPLTFTAVPAVLLAAAVLACLVPARRATRVDPMTALRAE